MINERYLVPGDYVLIQTPDGAWIRVHYREFGGKTLVSVNTNLSGEIIAGPRAYKDKRIQVSKMFLEQDTIDRERREYNARYAIEESVLPARNGFRAKLYGFCKRVIYGGKT